MTDQTDKNTLAGETQPWAFDADDRCITCHGAPVFRVFSADDFMCIEDDERPEAEMEYLAHAQVAVILLNTIANTTMNTVGEALDAVRTSASSQVSAPSNDGYKKAWQEIVDLLGIPAQNKSPREIHEQQVMTALRESLRTSTDPEGDLCETCGCKFNTTYRLPDDIWAKIAPRPDDLGLYHEHQGGGVLCLPCADKAASKLGITLRFDGRPDWPDPEAIRAKALREAAEYIKGKSGVIPGANVFASLVSGNNQPCMSGDMRDRMRPHVRKQFDQATENLAQAILALIPKETPDAAE